MTDDEQDFFNKSIGKLEKEIIALNNELENSLQTSRQNESKLKKLLKECREEVDKAKNILTEDTNIDNTVVAHAILRKILIKIDNAIGEE